MKTKTSKIDWQKGFTLIEVMVAVFVLSVGMLGVAGMQSVGVRESQNSVFRTKADMLANDAVDRMRANPAAVSDATNPYVSAGIAVVAANNCQSAAAACDALAIADFDLSKWQAQITQSSLPSGLGTISRAGTTNVYTVQVFWDENRDGSSGRGCNPAVSSDMSCIKLVVVL